MLRLASMLYSIIGTSLAGALIVLALVAGFTTAQPLLIAAVAGFVLALPFSWLVAQKITHLNG